MNPSDEPLSGVGITAVLVAGARAAESARADGLFHDPFARVFLEAAGAASTTVAAAVAQSTRDEAVSRMRRDAVAVRTRYFDDYLSGAAEAGCRQIVLLAAGLDARAFRLGWPDGLKLWELDMPGVFAFKECVLAERGARPRCERTIVPIDLREDWPAALSRAGFDASVPTAWLAEGLLMYLDERERDRLLDRVGALSGSGSRLAVDHRSGFFSPPPLPDAGDEAGERWASKIADLAAAAASDASLVEPVAWLARHGWRATVEDAAAVLRRHGRTVPAALQSTATGAPRGWIASAERL